jgi:hypothetical protein
MKLKYSFLFLVFFSIISCQKNNFELIYEKDLLKLSDCKNIDLVKWIFLKETGLEIEQEIQVIVTDYFNFGGIPLDIKILPVYYEVQINENQYNEYIDKILNSNDANSWGFLQNDDKLIFRRVTKFELGCTIEKNVIQFGFRMVEGIMP